MLFLLIVEIEMYGVGAVYSVFMLVRLRGSRSCRGWRARWKYKGNFARFIVLTAAILLGGYALSTGRQVLTFQGSTLL